MKFLIAGGAGSVGQALTAFFIQKGHEVRVLVKEADRLRSIGPKNLELVKAKEALGRGATLAGTSTTTGDGGMTPDERGHSIILVYQYLPSRYGMNPGGASCEFAIVVADAWQGKGIGTRLMTLLMEAAKVRDFRLMEGTVLAVNTPMLNLVRRLGLDVQPIADSPSGYAVSREL